MRKIHHNARALRSATTDAERKLWHGLRSRQLQGLKFRRQYPIAGYIADFACPEARLVIELDGGQHLEHTAYDLERSRKLAINGYQVLRFWNDDVLLRTEAVLEEICRQLQPHPNPSGPPAQPSGVRQAAGQWPANGPPHPLQAGEGANSTSE